jgi:hypothetical protein
MALGGGVVGQQDKTSARDLAGALMQMAQLNLQKKTQKDLNFLKAVESMTGGDPDALIDLAADNPDFLTKGFASALNMKEDEAKKFVGEIPLMEKTMRGQLNDAFRILTAAGAGKVNQVGGTKKVEVGTAADQWQPQQFFDTGGTEDTSDVPETSGGTTGFQDRSLKGAGMSGPANPYINKPEYQAALSDARAEYDRNMNPTPVEGKAGMTSEGQPLDREEMLRRARQMEMEKAVQITGQVVAQSGADKNPVLTTPFIPSADAWVKISNGQINGKEALQLAEAKLDPRNVKDRETANKILNDKRKEEALNQKIYEEVSTMSNVNMSDFENRKKINKTLDLVKESGFLSKSIQQKLNQNGYQEVLTNNIAVMIQNFGGNAEMFYRSVFPEANNVANTELQRLMFETNTKLDMMKISQAAQTAGIMDPEKLFQLRLTASSEVNAVQKTFIEYVNKNYDGDMVKALKAIDDKKDPVGVRMQSNLRNLIEISSELKDKDYQMTNFILRNDGIFRSKIETVGPVIPNTGGVYDQPQSGSQTPNVISGQGNAVLGKYYGGK